MNTTKKLISLTLAAAMSLSLAACGGGGTSAGSTPPPSGSSTGSGAVQSVADYDIQPELDSSVDYTQGDSYSFIIATDGAEDRVDGLLVHYMADQLNAITGGRIQLQMYFNGSMGTDTELCESTQAGDVAFFLGSTAFTANFVPELNAIDLPFLYQDAQQFRDTMDDETVFRFYEEKYQDKGFELIGFFDQGMRQMTSNIKVQSPDDMQGQKIRVMENQLHISIWQALGANPTPMAFSEVYMALQQGTIDAQENPVPIIETNKFDEVQTYLSMTGHLFSPAPVFIGKAYFDALPAEYQTAVQEAADEAVPYQREQIDLQNESGLEALQERGMQVNYPDKAAFQEATAPIYEQYIKDEAGCVSPDIYNRVLEVLEEVRAGA